MEEREGNVRLNLKGEVYNYCRLHTQLMDVKDDYSSGMKTLRRVAKSLNTIDWSKIMESTPDFLVAAVDDHGEVDPREDIKAVIPAAKFRSLRKQSLI